MAKKLKSIRIIKREQRVFRLGENGCPKRQRKTATQERREILKNVTLWIEEQREAKKTLRWEELFEKA